MADLLAQYRKKPLGETVTTEPPKGPEDYVAFESKDNVDRLTILRADDPTRSPGYPYLLDVIYDGPYGTNFTLLYTFLVVMVRGRYLLPVVAALKMGKADFIQEFDPEKWKIPADPKAPFIESIEVVVKEGGPSIADTEKDSRSLH